MRLIRKNDIFIDDESGVNTAKSVILYDTNIIKSGGDSQMFIGKFYDDKGNEVADVSPHWTIICDFTDKLILKEYDNSLSIGIDDDSYIDEEFKLICSIGNEDNVLSSSLIIRIDSLL